MSWTCSTLRCVSSAGRENVISFAQSRVGLPTQGLPDPRFMPIMAATLMALDRAPACYSTAATGGEPDPFGPLVALGGALGRPPKGRPFSLQGPKFPAEVNVLRSPLVFKKNPVGANAPVEPANHSFPCSRGLSFA